MDAKPLCIKHRSEASAWQGTSCGGGGWMPGHRLPAGVTTHDVDRQVKMIKEFCASGRNCGDVEGDPRCQSRDRVEWQLPNSPVKIYVHASDVCTALD